MVGGPSWIVVQLSRFRSSILSAVSKIIQFWVEIFFFFTFAVSPVELWLELGINLVTDYVSG